MKNIKVFAERIRKKKYTLEVIRGYRMDKYFDVNEMMIEYSEMGSFDFGSNTFKNIETEVGEYSKQGYTFKYGNYDCLDFIHGLIEGV